MSSMTLGELIALSRELNGWSLRELEKRCGISNALLSQIETGKIQEPGFHKVVRIARALGLSLNRLAETQE
jgi:transcriptional regulator with XRE-family HTH domain